MPSYLGSLRLTVFEKFWVFLKGIVGSTCREIREAMGKHTKMEPSFQNIMWATSHPHHPSQASSSLFSMRREVGWLCKVGDGMSECRKGDKEMMREECNRISMPQVLLILLMELVSTGTA